jgi:hypothetical protein
MTNLYTLKFVTCLSTLFLSVQVACLGQPIVIADTTVAFRAWSFGVGVGITTLPTLQTTYHFQKRWALRVGYDYMGYNQTDWKLAQGKITTDVQVRLSRFVLLGHYLPFRTEKFGILAGLAVFPTKTFTATFHLAQNIQLDGLLITPAAVGTGLFKLGYQHHFAPYIGITLGRPVPAGHSGWRLDIGTYYVGAFELKQLTIDSKIFLKENEANIGVLERNLNDS